jgi:hypothetical protein
MTVQFRFRLRSIFAAIALSAVILAVIVIIGNGREAAARAECATNLKQIGLGLVNYACINDNASPFGTIVNDQLPPSKRLSWFVALWSDMDQWFWLLDRSKSWDADENRITKGRGTEGEPQVVGQVKGLTCPSVREDEDAHMPGWTSYVGIAGLGRDAATLPKTDPRAGYFGYDRQTFLGDV